MKVDLKMLNKRVLVERDPEPDLTKSAGGIVLMNPPSFMKKITKGGVVVACGEDCPVKVGDHVVYYDGAAANFDYFDKKLDMVRSEELLGIEGSKDGSVKVGG